MKKFFPNTECLWTTARWRQPALLSESGYTKEAIYTWKPCDALYRECLSASFFFFENVALDSLWLLSGSHVLSVRKNVGDFLVVPTARREAAHNAHNKEQQDRSNYQSNSNPNSSC